MFIKLEGWNGILVRINIKHIIFYNQYSAIVDGTKEFRTEVIVSDNKGTNRFTVKETPEEIDLLIYIATNG